MGTGFDPSDFEYAQFRILRFPKKGYFDSAEIAAEFKKDLERICTEQYNVITYNDENGYPLEFAIARVMFNGQHGTSPYIKCTLYPKEVEESE